MVIACRWRTVVCTSTTMLRHNARLCAALLRPAPRGTAFSVRCFATQDARGPTGFVMLNMGGPGTTSDVGQFLHNLFSDTDIIQMPLQRIAGPLIARLRTPKIEKLYEEIGGGSPITPITQEQCRKVEKRMDQLCPSSAPHKGYLAFRYSGPSTAEALQQMKEDGVRRAVAFSQYPQWSCATTGSSLNELWRVARELGMEDAFQWSIVDRWFDNEKYIDALVQNVRSALKRFPTEQDAAEAVILFSAHSLPISQIDRGETYPKELGATTHKVMDALGFRHKHLLCYQSQVLKGLGRQGHKNVLIIPIAFTSDHVETLHEIDIEFAEVAHEAGITNFIRSDSLNASDHAVAALADVLKAHLDSVQRHSTQYPLRCPECVKDRCRQILNPI